MFNSLEMSFHCQDRQNSYYMYNSNLTLESSGLVFGEVHTMTKFLPGGGRGVLPYISYISLCRPIGYGFAPFSSENGSDTLYPFWSGIGYGFRGTTGVYGGIYRFNSK